MLCMVDQGIFYAAAYLLRKLRGWLGLVEQPAEPPPRRASGVGSEAVPMLLVDDGKPTLWQGDNPQPPWSPWN